MNFFAKLIEILSGVILSPSKITAAQKRFIYCPDKYALGLTHKISPLARGIHGCLKASISKARKPSKKAL